MKARTAQRSAVGILLVVGLLVALSGSAMAGPIERGRDVFSLDDTTTIPCGFSLDRQLDFAGNWLLKYDADGNVTSWQGTVTASATITNPANGRSATTRAAGLDRETYVDGTVIYNGTGTGQWATLPGSGPVAGAAGHFRIVTENGNLVSFEFNGLDIAGSGELCDYLAGA